MLGGFYSTRKKFNQRIWQKHTIVSLSCQGGKKNRHKMFFCKTTVWWGKHTTRRSSQRRSVQTYHFQNPHPSQSTKSRLSHSGEQKLPYLEIFILCHISRWTGPSAWHSPTWSANESITQSGNQSGINQSRNNSITQSVTCCILAKDSSDSSIHLSCLYFSLFLSVFPYFCLSLPLSLSLSFSLSLLRLRVSLCLSLFMVSCRSCGSHIYIYTHAVVFKIGPFFEGYGSNGAPLIKMTLHKSDWKLFPPPPRVWCHSKMKKSN